LLCHGSQRLRAPLLAKRKKYRPPLTSFYKQRRADLIRCWIWSALLTAVHSPGRNQSPSLTASMVYLNPGGFDFGSENLDGYGISNIVFGVTYSLFFYAAVLFVWLYRHHPILRMRNVPLMLLSLLTLHVFTFMVFVVYTLNGAFPCQVEFWCMSIYLPIGIGLFQAQNQQLLIVSRQQTELLTKDESYRPILPKGGKGLGGPRYWLFRLKFWCRGVSTQGTYQGFVAIGIFVQVCYSSPEPV